MKYTITIYDDFFKKEYKGQFDGVTQADAENEARDFYAYELDCNTTDINIIKTEVVII